MVPTIKNAQNMSLNEISAKAKELAATCKNGGATPDMLSGASFTVSNVGSYGIESFTPVINTPQTGILGVDTITTRIREVNGEIKTYPAMGLSLTYDHRALDGSPASRFLVDLRNALRISLSCFPNKEDLKWKNMILSFSAEAPADTMPQRRPLPADLKPLVIEKRALGGVCLNEGCVPSKSLLYSGKVYNYVVNGDHYGVTATGAAIDQKKVIERKNKVVKTLVSGIGAQMKKLGVKVVYAEGKILGRDAEGFKLEAEGETYVSDKLLVATGSAPVVPPIPGLREGLSDGFVMTNREILDLEEIPRKPRGYRRRSYRP